jgi:hypothetical protein
MNQYKKMREQNISYLEDGLPKGFGGELVLHFGSLFHLKKLSLSSKEIMGLEGFFKGVTRRCRLS